MIEITLRLESHDLGKMRQACIKAWRADDGFDGEPPQDLAELIADVFDWNVSDTDGPLDCGVEQVSVDVVMKHSQDSDCTVDPATDLCVGCGVHHGEVCEHCGGRGFHRDDCSPPIARSETFKARERDWKQWASV